MQPAGIRIEPPPSFACAIGTAPLATKTAEPAEEAPEVLAVAVRRALAGWLTLAEEAHRREYGGDYTILHGHEPRWPLPPGLAGRLLENPMAWLDAERAAIVCSFRQAISLGLTELGWDLALTAVTLFEAKGYFADWRETAKIVRHEHREILSAIEEARADDAQQLVHAHIIDFYERGGFAPAARLAANRERSAIPGGTPSA